MGNHGKVSKYYVHNCTSGKNFANIRSIFLGSKGPKTSQKEPFGGCWIGTENFNLATTNAILLKLTTIMYLHESVNRKALRARNSDLWVNF